MTRTHTTTIRAFGAGILEGRAVPEPRRDVPNGHQNMPTGQLAPAPEGPSKGPIEFRVECMLDGWPVLAIFKVHPSKLKTALQNLARYGLRPRTAKGGGS